MNDDPFRDWLVDEINELRALDSPFGYRQADTCWDILARYDAMKAAAATDDPDAIAALPTPVKGGEEHA